MSYDYLRSFEAHQEQEAKAFMKNLPTSSDRNANLCNLLAQEGIRIQYKPVSTASFDVVDRLLTIPTWRNVSAAVIDRIIIHEVGHALATTQWVELGIKYGNAMVSRVANIFEDRRVDNFMKDRYPGTKKDYAIAAREIVEKNLFETNGKNVNDYNFYDRANLLSKIGHYAGVIEFSEEEKVRLKRIDSIKSTEEAFALAFEFLEEDRNKREEEKSKEPEQQEEGDSFEELEDDKVEQESPEPQAASNEEDDQDDAQEEPEQEVKPEDDQSHEEEEDAEEGDKTQSDGQNDSEESDSETGEEDSQGDYESPEEEASSDEQEAEEEEDAEDFESSVHQDEGDSQDDDQVESQESETSYTESDEGENLETDRMFEDMMENEEEVVFQTHITHFQDVDENPHKMIIKNKEVIADIPGYVYGAYKKDELKKIKAEAMQLFKEFNVRKSAKVQNVFFSDKGSIDMNRLHEYRTNDNIFQRSVKQEKNESNHKFYFLIDYSGSMKDTRIRFAMRQASVFREFCKMAGIDFVMYLFTTKYSHILRSLQNEYKFNVMSGEFGLGDYVRLLEVCTKDTSDKDWNNIVWSATKGRFQTYGMGYTPLTVACKIVKLLMEEFHQINPDVKLSFITLTDGQESNTSKIKAITERKGKYYSSMNCMYISQLEQIQEFAHAVIGFNICQGIGEEVRIAHQNNYDVPENYFDYRAQIKQGVKKNGIYTVGMKGYDKYIFVSDSYVNTLFRRFFKSDEITEKSTPKAISRAYMKEQKSKVAAKLITQEISSVIA